jgi:hypothetical protein
MHAINPSKNSFQEFPKVKRRNAAAHRKYTVSMFKLETINTTAKMEVSIQLRSGTMCSVDPRRDWLSALLFR